MEVEKMKGNEILLIIVNSILKIIDRLKLKIKIDNNTIRNGSNIDYFDDDQNFYLKILSKLSSSNLEKVFKNVKELPLYFLRNLRIFLEYLQILININKFKQLYNDPIIKLDISLIVEYLYDKYGAKIIEQIEFFSISKKELEIWNKIY